MATDVLQATPRRQVSRGHGYAEIWPWPWRRGWSATIELPTGRRSTCLLVVTGDKGSRPAEELGQADAVLYEDKRNRCVDRPRDVPPMGAAGGAGQA